MGVGGIIFSVLFWGGIVGYLIIRPIYHLSKAGIEVVADKRGPVHGAVQAGIVCLSVILVCTFWTGVVMAGTALIESIDWSTPATATTPAARPRFCDTHDCVAGFEYEGGSIVQCADGVWSHAGGLQGACSSHGGVPGSEWESPLDETPLGF